jgi:hypothetical protein
LGSTAAQSAPPVFESEVLLDSDDDSEQATLTQPTSLALELETRVAAHARLLRSVTIALAAAVPDTFKARMLSQQRAAAADDLRQLAGLFSPCAELLA